MQKLLFIICVVAVIFTTGCSPSVWKAKKLETADLEIHPLTSKTYVHITYFESETFGKVPCNGLVYVHQNEAIVFDTPVHDSTSAKLINWVEQELKCRVKAVVINHFHEDCLGGLAAFHKHNIRSYANYATLELAKKSHSEVPEVGFESYLELELGDAKVINRFFGEAHTVDNIVSYVPSEAVLFGGCMVKAMNAGKGNLADANVKAWAATVAKVKAAHPTVRYVVPGHGKVGDVNLLDYTIKMFENDAQDKK